ncbi:MAG: hypothetical protein KF773_24275 [Deltaproteobacteria bacterium]|nr:hypothetical protein [Deltaproteobacteria bacterium]
MVVWTSRRLGPRHHRIRVVNKEFPMRATVALLSMFASIGLASCANGLEDSIATVASAVERKTVFANDALEPREWSNDVTEYWDESATSMMVLYTPDGEHGDVFYAWGVANGISVAWLYKVPTADAEDFQVRVQRSFVIAHDAAPERYWGGGGAVGGGRGGGGPVGPGGDGFTPEQVARVLLTAGAIDDATSALLGYRSGAL